MQRIFCFLLTASLVFNASCIHMESSENKKLDLEKNEKNLASMNKEDLQIESQVYIEEKYPLNDFFHDLKSGKLTQAFHNIDLKYRPSNSKSQVLRELIADGYIPVYVRVKNIGKKSIRITERNFFLVDKGVRINAILSTNIPKEFSRFNSTAVAANVYNVTVTTVAIVGVIALLAAAAVAAKGNTGGFGFPGGSGGGSGPDGRVLNDTHFTTRIDYQDLLFQPKRIQPDESLEGLLFFINPDKESHDFHLEFGPPEVSDDEHL